MAKVWQREPASVAALYSFTTDCMNLVPDFKGNKHSKEVTRLFRMALAASLPMEIVSEEEVETGILKRFKAICLHDAQYIPGEVAVALRDFIKQGGKVYVDADYLYTDAWKPRVKAPIEGALEVAPETMVQMLVDQVERAVVVSSGDISMRRFVAGDAEYVVLVNNYRDRYWGMSYAYRSPTANFAKADLIKGKKVSTTIRFSKGGRTVFDLSNGKRIGTTDRALDMTIEPSWGRVLMTLPAASAKLVLDLPREVRQGEALPIKLSMVDGKGRVIAAAFAVKVAVIGPSGKQSAASGFVALKKGVGTFVLPIGVNEATGRWHVIVEGGFPRRTTRDATAVTPRNREIDLLLLSAVRE